MSRLLNHNIISNIYQVLIILIFSSSGISKSSNLQLKSNENQADYLIITAKQFLETIQPLVEFRKNQGLNIVVLEDHQIYEETADSLSKAQSIRQFISYVLETWQAPQPKYLLLIGDEEIIPTFKVPSQLPTEDSISVDEWFGINQYETDNKPDVAVGRFPIKTKEELNNIIEKTISFETTLNRSDYYKDFLFLVDYDNYSTTPYFENITSDFINEILPPNYNFTRIDIRPDSPYAGNKSELLETLNSSSLFFNFSGFANPFIFSRDSVFLVNDIDSLRDDNKPFIFTTLTSLQRFDLPDTVSIVEKLINKSGSGAVASFASTGLCYLSRSDKMISDFYEYLFSNPSLTIGEIILKVKRETKFYDTSIENNYDSFTLLGDPALNFPNDIITNVKQNENLIPLRFDLLQNYPNPFNSSTIISFSIPESRHVTLKIFNILGEEIVTLVDKQFNSGKHSIEWFSKGFPSGIYLYQIKAGNFIKTRKLILQY